MTTRDFDVAVIGAGFGGVVAAVRAAERGRRVVLIEARDEIGGTAMFSGGGVHIWSARTWAEYRKTCPLADPVLARALFDGYMPFVDWAVASGAPGGWGVSTNRGVTIAKYQVGDSIAAPGREAWFRYMRRRLERLGGQVLTGARAHTLITDSRSVCGLILDKAGATRRITAHSVILAAGGFQNSPELLTQYIGAAAPEFVCRGVTENLGDALGMAQAVGAGLSPTMGTLYGHLMPAPPCAADLNDHMTFLLLSAFYAEHGVVVNAAGQRFVDEGDGELTGATINAAAQQPRGGLWIVMDQQVRERFARYELPADVFRPANLRLAGLVRYLGLRWTPRGPVATMDSLRYAADRGALIVSAATPDALALALATHGVDGAGLLATLSDFNAHATAGRAGDLAIPKIKSAHPLTRGPFHAVKVAVGVSMTYGGVRIDRRARVLDDAGAVIRGLYACPGAAGGVHHLHYAGALAACGVFGKIAGDRA